MRTMLAFLLLCCTAFAADPANGPTFGIWHLYGHGVQWQLDRQAAGLPLEPGVLMQTWLEYHMAYTGALDQAAPMLSQFDRQPIALRMNNVLNELDYTIPRVKPLTEENYRTSHMCVRRLAGGALDDTPQPSPWADETAWAKAGELWSKSPWMVRLQQIIPNPTGVILRENNEGPKISLAMLYLATRVFYVRTDNNSLQFASVTTPRDKYVDGNRVPLGPEWTVFSAVGENVNVYRWKTDAELDGLDLRAKEWVEPRRALLPMTLQADFDALYRPKYQALFAAFQANLSPNWQAVPFGTCGYGWDSFHDAGSPPAYTNYYAERPASLTSPGWNTIIRKYRDRWISETDPKEWREASIKLAGVTVLQSVVDGTGDFIDAESYAGFNMHWAWAMQSPGRAVRLVWWDNYNTLPTLLIAGAYKDKLTQLGRPDLATMTITDCEVAVMRSELQIHTNPTINRYWREGTTQLLSSPLNDAKVTRVYATETTIPGVQQTLLCVYSPCTIGPVQVGGYTLPEGFKRFGYYLTNVGVVEVK